MPRRKRTITSSEEGILNLMDEVYNDFQIQNRIIKSNIDKLQYKKTDADERKLEMSAATEKYVKLSDSLIRNKVSFVRTLVKYVIDSNLNPEVATSKIDSDIAPAITSNMKAELNKLFRTQKKKNS